MTKDLCPMCGRLRSMRFRVNRVKGGHRIVARSETGKLCYGCALKTANTLNAQRAKAEGSHV